MSSRTNEDCGDFQEQDSSNTLYGRDHRTPVFNERRMEHDANQARLAQSRERRHSKQQMRATHTQPTAFTSDGFCSPYELPKTPVPQVTRQQLDSRQWGMAPSYSSSPLSTTSRANTESGYAFSNRELEHPFEEQVPDNQRLLVDEDNSPRIQLPPISSMITSTPSNFQRSKRPLNRQARPSTPGSAQDQSPYFNGPPRALVKRAGPPSAAYPISISTKPTSPRDMLSASTHRDSSEPCLGISHQQDDVFQASSTDHASRVKRYFDSPGIDSDDEAEELAAKADSPPSKKSKTRATQRALPGARKRIVEVAKIHLRAMISTQEPFAVGVAVDTLLTDAWLAGHHEVAEDLRLPDDLLPEEDELVVLRQAVSSYRSTVKLEAQGKVPSFFGFEKGSGDTTPVDIINKNKALYAALTAKTFAWAYTDPYDTKKPGTMLRHPIVQTMVNTVLFSEGEGSLAFKGDYFNPNEEGLSFTPIAFLLTAIQNAIDEYKTGYWEIKPFSAQAFTSTYKKFLKKLEDWHKYTTTKSNSRAAEKFRQEVWAAGREYSGVTVLNLDDDREESGSESDFAANEA